MRLKRKVRITLTEEKVVWLAGACERGAAWCPRCAAFVPMLTPEQAAALAGVSTRQVFRWLEAGALHFDETTGPTPLVCQSSLPPAARAAGEEGRAATAV